MHSTEAPHERRATLHWEQCSAKNKKENRLMAQELYLVRVKGHLGSQWNEWFDGFTITTVEHGETIISGPIVDQAALQGLLRKVYDLGLSLLTVNRVPAEESAGDEIESS